jgi:hypothetical protein
LEVVGVAAGGSEESIEVPAWVTQLTGKTGDWMGASLSVGDWMGASVSGGDELVLTL